LARATPAQEIGVRAGLAAAERLCAECHAVHLGDLRSPNAGAPTFPVIAAAPGVTSAALRAALNTSHRIVSSITLSSDQAEAIVAYILSLRQPG
jgi:mono/diheme cytochrome c family protein